MRRALVYSGSVFVLLLAAAGLVPVVLGSEYAATAAALRWLAILPVLKALHYFFSDTLTSSGYQGVRTGIQAGVALLNVLLNLWVIPAYSWKGAAWSSIACDATLLGGVSLAVWFLSRTKSDAKASSRERESTRTNSSQPFETNFSDGSALVE